MSIDVTIVTVIDIVLGSIILKFSGLTRRVLCEIGISSEKYLEFLYGK